MKKTTILFAILVSLTIMSCGDKSSKGADTQSSPAAVAETIFDAAKNGKYDNLPGLIDAEADGDSKRIGAAGTDDASKEEFKTYFSKGKLNGDSMIEGDKAFVKILFGPDGDKEETFEMVKKDGKWYLKSF